MAEVIRCRTAPKGFYNFVSQLNEEQRDAVREIGFGPLLSLGLQKCPQKFCVFLVRSFQVARMALEFATGDIEVDEEDIEDVLQLPRGELNIMESTGGKDSDSMGYDLFIQSWKQRWDIRGDQIIPSTAEMSTIIIENGNSDANFNVDFVVYMVSSFLCSTQNPHCRFKIFRSLMRVEQIRHYNWCHFALRGLLEGVRNWKEKEQRWFTGPITFLMVGLSEQPFSRLPPVIALWDEERMKEMLKYEEFQGGFGLGRILPRMPRNEEANFEEGGDHETEEQEEINDETDYLRRVGDAMGLLSHVATTFQQLSLQNDFQEVVGMAASNVNRSTLQHLRGVIGQIIDLTNVEEGSPHDVSYPYHSSGLREPFFMMDPPLKDPPMMEERRYPTREHFMPARYSSPSVYKGRRKH